MRPPRRDAAHGDATTYLFVPADRPERLPKALAAGADAVIVDLEDAVDPAHKAAARAALHQALLSAPNANGNDSASACALWVRVNAVDTPWFAEDLDLLRTHTKTLAGLMLPKAESARDVDALQALDLPVIALVESARGLLGLAALAAHADVVRLAFGSADLARDLGCEDAWDTLLPHRASLVQHAAAAGLPAPIDGVSFALDQPEQVASDARQALRLGFGAKLCIHPAQVAACRQGFTPTDAQQQWARAVLAAAAGDSGAQRVAGQMIDRPVVERARRLLQRAQHLQPPTQPATRPG